MTMIAGKKAVVRTIDFTNVSERVRASQVIPFPRRQKYSPTILDIRIVWFPSNPGSESRA